MAFERATKRRAKGRLGLIGPSGSGKTYTALRVAKCLGERIALLDTERGSASKYADLFHFDVCELVVFSPRNYIAAIQDAERGGYEVLILDSLSHAWSGKGGVLEMKDAAAKRSRSNNSFAAWRDVTPIHNQLVDAILGADLHIIATMRVKTEWVIEEDDRGKKHPRRIGLQPEQRAGLEYEFDVLCDLDHSLDCTIAKTRCPDLQGKVFREAGEADLGATFAAWLGTGAEPPAVAEPPAPADEPAPPARKRTRKKAARKAAPPPGPEPNAPPAAAPEQSVRKAGTGTEWMTNKDVQYVRRELALARLADLGLEPADGKLLMRDLYAHLGAQLGGDIKNLHDVPRSSLMQIENFIADWAPRDDPPAAGKEVF